jgi:hypothetical protein
LREVHLDLIWTPRPLPCESGPHLDLAVSESLDLTASVWHHTCLARTRAVENAIAGSGQGGEGDDILVLYIQMAPTGTEGKASRHREGASAGLRPSARCYARTAHGRVGV